LEYNKIYILIMTLNEEQIESLVFMVLYLHEEERKDQQECGCEDHMFFNVDKIKNALQHAGIDMDLELKIYNDAQ